MSTVNLLLELLHAVTIELTIEKKSLVVANCAAPAKSAAVFRPHGKGDSFVCTCVLYVLCVEERDSARACQQNMLLSSGCMAKVI